MRQHQPRWRTLIFLLVVVATVATLAIYLVSGLLDTRLAWLTITKLSLVAFVAWLLWEWFRRRLWKVSLFRGWLVDVPDVSGIWKGMVAPNLVDPETGRNIPEIPCTWTIQQRFTSISIQFKTDSGSSRSHSISANFVIDEDSNRCRLVYTYENEASRTEDDLDDHCGTAVLEIEDNPPTRMVGFYMNDRKNQSKGNITMSRVSA